MASFYRNYELIFEDMQGEQKIFSQTKNSLGLAISFVCRKSIENAANEIDIEIINASKDTRKALEAEGTISLKVGYEDDLGLIFKGKKVTTSYREDSSDKVFTISAMEGVSDQKKHFANTKIPKGSTTKTIVDDLVNFIVGNVDAVDAANDYIIDAEISYPSATTVSGNVFDYLNDYLKPVGYGYFINNGKLNIIKTNGATVDVIVDVSPTNGLIGSASSINGADDSKQKDQLTGVEFRSLLNFNLDVGRKVKLTSDSETNTYKVDSIVHNGNSYEGEWTSEVRAMEFTE